MFSMINCHRLGTIDPPPFKVDKYTSNKKTVNLQIIKKVEFVNERSKSPIRIEIKGTN